MLTIFEFQKKFPDDDSCYQYLYDKKWPNGFSCPRCPNKKAYFLKKRKLMQCTSCKHQTSVTAGTVFHKLRLPLHTLFWTCFWVATTKKGISAKELMRKVGIKSYPTAWTLLHKIRHAMHSSGTFPIESDVEYDDTYLGVKKKSKDNKRALVNIVVETNGKTIGRAYIEHLPNQTMAQVKKFVHKTVALGVTIKTDGNVSYKFMKNEYVHRPMKMYDKKDNNKHLPKVHIVITNLKNWLRGTYNHLPHKHAQSYLNEFCFRFNRRWTIDNIFDKLVNNILTYDTITYAELTI